MFELSGADLAALSDDDLRELVRLLCVAELTDAGLPVSGVLAGGNQDAADGGVDVSVETRPSPALDFVPKPLTYFQSKATDLTPAQVKGEMAPDGVLRDSIREVLQGGGAYVIVASKSSLTHTRLRGRKDAMAQAAAEIPEAAPRLHFYDRDRLAGWLARYPGVALWTRERLGRPLTGWHPHGAWPGMKATAKGYVIDDNPRVICRTSRQHEQLGIADALGRIRHALSAPRGVARLVGLSGVGKTRLAEALFDARVGAAALDPANAIYADIGMDPDPQPPAMLAQLQASKRRTVLVIDNCRPEAHRALVEQLSPKSCVSLLTIEYDVGDDEKEETEVFELEPASDQALEEILSELTPDLHPLDRRKVVEFSGGNARIALALAAALGRSGSIGQLDNKALLQRLFWQRNAEDPALRRSAEALALVYSFDGETLGEDSELHALARLAETTEQQLYAHVAELRRRDLVQARSRWRALLPHALANRLAAAALENIPCDTITAALASRRLTRSLGRRLSFLHDSPQAVQIAETWFADSHRLGTTTGLDPDRHTLYLHLAPLAPASALAGCLRALEDLKTVDAFDRSRWGTLLYKLAYEPRFFDAAVTALVQLAATDRHRPGDANQFSDLFHLCFSGTLAPVAQRLKLIERLLADESEPIRRCGSAALLAMFEAHHFSLHHDVSFGALPRTFGWHPQSNEEVRTWYVSVLRFFEQKRIDLDLDQKVLPALSRALNSLWRMPGLPGEVVSLAKRCNAQGEWADLWYAAKRMIKRGQYPEPELLAELEVHLRPRSLMQRVTAAVFGQSTAYLDFDDDDADDAPPVSRYERLQEKVMELGRETVRTTGALRELSPGLVRVASGQQGTFCIGVAEATPSLQQAWDVLLAAYQAQAPSGASFDPLGGFIAGARRRDRAFADRLLDMAVKDPLLRSVFPLLQSYVLLDEEDVPRIIDATRVSEASPEGFERLAGVSRALSDDSFAEMVRAIASMRDGAATAAELLSLRLHIDEGRAQGTLAEVGRTILAALDYESSRDQESYRYKVIAAGCLTEGHEDDAASVCARISAAMQNSYSVGSNWGELIAQLFRRFPTIALDAFLAEDRSYLSISGERFNPLNEIPEETFLAWARRDPAVRFNRLGAWIRVLDRPKDESMRWSKHAELLLANAPDQRSLLSSLRSGFRLNSWTGSEYVAVKPYFDFAVHLSKSTDSIMAEWATSLMRDLAHRMARSEQEESGRDRSFE